MRYIALLAVFLLGGCATFDNMSREQQDQVISAVRNIEDRQREERRYQEGLEEKRRESLNQTLRSVIESSKSQEIKVKVE